MKCSKGGCLKRALAFAPAVIVALAISAFAQGQQRAPFGQQENGQSTTSAAPPSGQPVQPDKSKAYYHYSLGHLYEERGSMFNRPELLTQAIDELRLALQYDPSSTFLTMELADLYAATGRWRSALQEVEDAVRRNPQDMGARRLLGRLYIRLLGSDQPLSTLPADLPQQAIREFEQIVQRDPNDVGSYLVLAQLYRAVDDNAKAEETLKKALALQPESSDAEVQLALLYVDEGAYRSAIDLLQRVVRKDDDPQLLNTLAYAYEQMKDYSSAADAYSRALQRDPDNTSLRKGLGQSLMYARKYDQAIEQFQAVVEANPRDAESLVRLSQIYRYQGKFKEADDALSKAAQLAPDDLEISFNRVLLQESQGDTPAAVDTIRKVLDATAKLGPNYYTAQEKTNRSIFLEKLGDLQRDQGNFSAAEDAYNQMIELGGDAAIRGRVHLLEVYQQNHQYDKALQASAEALRDNPDSRELVSTRASLLSSVGDVDGAVQLLKPLLKGNAEDREIWLSLVQVYLRAKRFDDALDAASHADELSESEDEKAYIAFLYGSIWERQEKFDKAEEQFRKALQLNPDSAMTLNYLGYMFADRGIKLDEAVQFIQRALEMEPNSGAYLDSLGWAYYKQNKLDMAEDYLRKAVARIPNDPTILDHLGDVYYKRGRVSEAVAQWKLALEEWNRLPKNEVEPDDVARLERKLRDASAGLSQDRTQPQSPNRAQ